MAAVFRVIGPQRALATIARAFRTGDNFTQTACEVVSDHAARVTLRTTRLPHFVRGQLEGGLEFLKLPGTVTVVVDSDAEMVFEVAWQR